MKKEAKRAMLGKLRKAMRNMGGKHAVGGLGVEVHAKDKKGLIEGLEKAKEIAESDKMDDMIEEGKERSEEPSEGSERGECCKMSKEELEEKIAMMQEVLKSKED